MSSVDAADSFNDALNDEITQVLLSGDLILCSSQEERDEVLDIIQDHDELEIGFTRHKYDYNGWKYVYYSQNVGQVHIRRYCDNDAVVSYKDLVASVREAAENNNKRIVELFDAMLLDEV